MTPLILLPGIVMPAALRYGPLVDALGGGVRAVTKDLEVYAGPEPRRGYSIDDEVEGIGRFVDALGAERVHLYGHSAGGACALAFAARHPARVQSLALDEPATDFSAEDRAAMSGDLERIRQRPAAEQLPAFLRMQLAPGVEPPAPPPGPPPGWMARRPAGIDAFTHAIERHVLPAGSLGTLEGPVYFSHGRFSHPRWLAMRDRLARAFRRFTAEEYERAHHLNTSHQCEPRRVAAALTRLWSEAA